MADMTLSVVGKYMQPCRFLKSSEGTHFVPLSDLCAIFFMAAGFWSQSNWGRME